MNGAEYRNRLIEKRGEALQSLGMPFDNFTNLGRVADDDRALVSHEEFIQLRRNDLNREVLRLVEDAMERLASGTFGACQRCGDRIPEKRLRVIPWARYCVKCQDKVTAKAALREDLEAAVR